MKGREQGFEPVFCAGSRLLILGSFPSVKSRKEGFYYGNPQNRFWRTVCGFFGEDVPKTVEDKRNFLLRRKIALWDVVESCEIEGSSDASIRREKLADLPALVKKCGAPVILCNGRAAYGAIERCYPELLPMAHKLPSTSPANPRFSFEAWNSALLEVFPEPHKKS